MIRIGLGILVAAGTIGGAIALQACSSTDGSVTPGGSGGGSNAGGGSNTGGGNDTGGAGGGTPGGGCVGACCPTDAVCYSSSAGKTAPGAECLATQDNTGKDHIQMRQQWIRATTPEGNASGLVYAVLAGRTQLPWKTCNQSGTIGSGGYIQIIDFFLGGTDKTKHYSTVGYAAYVPGPTDPTDTTFKPAVLQDGFCYGQESYTGAPASGGKDYRLADTDMTPSTNFPPGLPHPMGLKTKPWSVGPTKAKRLDQDFDLAATGKREELLAMFDTANPNNIAKDGYGGVFYYDDATGTAHGFGALGWVVVYDATGATHIAVPIREVETRSKFNNKDAPNCVGKYLPDALDQSTCTAGTDPTKPGWGGGDCTATTGNATCQPGESAASTKGYFLISELEQIYAPDLNNTLCVTYPGTDPATSKPRVDAEGFYNTTDSDCVTAKWNPTLADGSGIPKGDWCAATNSAAHDNCHDAWHSISFHAFAGAKIKMDANGAPATCAY